MNVQYFNSISNLQNHTNPITSPYSSVGNEKIFVLVTNTLTNCSTYRFFYLYVTPPPVIGQPQSLTLCETDVVNHKAVFDLTTQNTVLLNGLTSANYSVTYYLSQADANTKTNPIGGSYTASNGVVIYARVTNNGDQSCFSIGTFTLLVNPRPLVDSLQNVVVCDSYILPTITNGNYFTGPNGTGDALFAGNVVNQSLTIYIYNSNGLCSKQSSFTISILNINSITPPNATYCDSYSLPSLAYGKYYSEPNGAGVMLHTGDVISSTQIIYIHYVSDSLPVCIADSHFTVTIIATPIIPNYPSVYACTSYQLPNLNLGNYYPQPNGQGTIIPAGTLITASTTIYVYAETGGITNCFSQDEIKITIGLPIVNDVIGCQGYNLPVLEYGNYFTGPNGTGTHLTSGSLITSSQTVYVYATYANGCFIDNNFHITVNLPLLSPLANVKTCGSFTLPTIPAGNYFTGTLGTGTQHNAGDILTTSQKVYIYLNNNGCESEKSFNVTIVPIPNIDSRANVDVCNSYTLTNLSVGSYYSMPNGAGTVIPSGSVLTTTQSIYVYAVNVSGTTVCTAENNFIVSIFTIEADNLPNVSACDSYILPVLTHGNYYTAPNGFHGTGTVLHAGDIITSSQTLYIYYESGERINCSDENTFTITINHTPVLSSITSSSNCGSFVLPHLNVGNYYSQSNGQGTQFSQGDAIGLNQLIYVYAATNTQPNCFAENSFQISIFKVDVLQDVSKCDTYLLPVLTNGNYYTGPNGTGQHLFSGDAIHSSQKIYIYAISTNAVCFDQSSFNVVIINKPIINSIPLNAKSICDTDGTNNGITIFPLNNLNTYVLGNQNNSSVSYYNTIQDANTGINPIITTSNSTVFIKVSYTNLQNCFAIGSTNIIVNRIPEPVVSNGVICLNPNTGNVINSFHLESGLSLNQYTFNWTNPSGHFAGNNPSIFANQVGNYTLTAHNLATGCNSLSTNYQITASQTAVITYEVSDAFSENQTITVSTTDTNGDYEYQLDDDNFQDSPVFENVTFGNHTIKVHDKNGCGTSEKVVEVANYPKFFTPNGDGINDTWKIIGFKGKAFNVIIYDRFGKFIKNINSDTDNWDGTLNQNLLPSDDYWFTVTYFEKGSTKDFKGHFSLKR